MFQCKEGDQVKIRVCGDFYFDPAVDSDVDLLLIAGGVGINPLYCMINEVTDLNKGDNSKRFTGRVMLLYSANTIEELIFSVRSWCLLFVFISIHTKSDSNPLQSNAVHLNVNCLFPCIYVKNIEINNV